MLFSYTCYTNVYFSRRCGFRTSPSPPTILLRRPSRVSALSSVTRCAFFSALLSVCFLLPPLMFYMCSISVVPTHFSTQWVVTTTIFAPTLLAKQTAALDDWCMCVLGDKKTVHFGISLSSCWSFLLLHSSYPPSLTLFPPTCEFNSHTPTHARTRTA
jgi:hypothetical protein